MTARADQITARPAPAHPQLAGPATPVAQFREFVDGFERLGYDVVALLARIGLRRADLDDPDALIACAATGALVESAMRERPLKNVGLRLAIQRPAGGAGLLDYLIVTSETVADAWKQVARYVRLLAGAPFTVELHEEEDPIRAVYQMDSSAANFGVEYGLALAVFHLREETENRARFECVSFTHQPDDVQEIERLLGCPVHARASWAGLAMRRESWQMPLRRKDPILHRVLEGHADSITFRGAAKGGIALDVRRVFAARLATGETEIEDVARHLGMSARTLQRRLASAGLSYQALLEDTRREAAERCITASSLSIAEVAYLLGYSEPAAFHRAFKRWTGVTPQAFRRRQPAGLASEAHTST